MTPAHGTPAGYRAHLRKKEEPCRRCSQANADYARKWRHRRAGTQKTVATTGRDALMDDYPAMTLGEWKKERGYDAERGVYA